MCFSLVYPVLDSLHLLDLIDYFLYHVRDIFDYNLFKYFLRPFLFLFFFWKPYNSNAGVFNVVPDVSETVLISFHLFIFFILLHGSYLHLSIFQLTYLSFCLYSALDSFLCIFHFSFCVVHHCLFFTSSRSLLNISYIFSILFPRFWIIFTIITLNSISSRLPLSSSFVWSGGFLPCSFICCIFLCLLILFHLLCLVSPFCRL